MADLEEVQTWLADYRNGSTEALEPLIEAFRRPLFGFILKMTEGREDAEEVFQEVWLRAIRKLDTYKSKSFLSWLFRIAHNLVIDRVRKRKPDCSLNAPMDDASTLEDKTPGQSLGPDQEVSGWDIGVRIQAAVNVLPPEQKEVFLMRTEAELPFKEIAEIQGISINTALARMQYALAKLKDELADEYESLSRS